MRLKYCILLIVSSFCFTSFGQSKFSAVEELRKELKDCPEKTGSSYYAYPGPIQKEYTPVPEGYSPVYISHYGRHGSRWVTADSRYTAVLDVFDTHELTNYGKEVRERLEIVWQDAKGCGGDLTHKGERQHHEIASRMFEHFPSLFQGHSKIRAVASTSRRCMMSMMAFCEGLKERNPWMEITRSAHERDMDYINYESPELKAFTSKTGDFWQNTLTPFIQSSIEPTRLIKKLFLSDLEENIRYDFFDGLYWIVSDIQNVELGDLSLYDLFTDDELYAYWTCQNLKMYTTNGPSIYNHGITKESSWNLLNQIVKEADAALSGGDISANLRFGHDSALIRLLTLMRIEECNMTTEDNEQVATVWQDFRITPMAANLQIVFYKNLTGNVLVKFLLNENEVSLPLGGKTKPYYDWNEVKSFWGF